MGQDTLVSFRSGVDQRVSAADRDRDMGLQVLGRP